MDLQQHLVRQMAFSRATFGPGPRTNGVIDHIRKELVEVQESNGSPTEWTDVVLLALDGLWRSVRAQSVWSQSDPKDVTATVVEFLERKQGKNELRDWPDWRTMSSDKAIEHVRT